MTQFTYSRLAARCTEMQRAADAFFGPGAVRLITRQTAVAVALCGLLLTIGTASADWYVRDSEAIRTLEKIRDAVGTSPDSVNQNLDDLHEQQKVQGAVYNPSQDEDTKSKLAESPDHADKSSVGQRRCGGKLSAGQKTVCDAIVKLEQDRYAYLQDMRKLSLKREEELKSIYEERKEIRDWEHGKLDSNTNRLLALIAHQRIDQLNLEMAMSTFDERLRDRRDEQTDLAQGLMDPSKKQGGLGDQIGNAAAQQLALEAALALARQRDR